MAKKKVVAIEEAVTEEKLTKGEAYLAELEEIARENDGILRPEAVVEYAKNPETALHTRFQWDNRRAGHEYRLWQARQLIRVSVRMLAGQNQRVFFSLRSDRTQAGGGYRPTLHLMSDAEKRQELLANALADLAMFRKKYVALQELAEIFVAIEKILPAQGVSTLSA